MEVVRNHHPPAVDVGPSLGELARRPLVATTPLEVVIALSPAGKSHQPPGAFFAALWLPCGWGWGVALSWGGGGHLPPRDWVGASVMPPQGGAQGAPGKRRQKATKFPIDFNGKLTLPRKTLNNFSPE